MTNDINLFIDNSDLKKTRVAIIDFTSKKIMEEVFNLDYETSSDTLGLIHKFLKKHDIEINQLKQLYVCSGPGSITGLRISMAIALGISTVTGAKISAIPILDLPDDLLDLSNFKPTKNPDVLYNRPAVR